MQFEKLMSYVANEIGLDALVPDENGVCQLISEQFTMNMQHCDEVGAVLSTAAIADITPDMPEALFRKLLALNHLFVKTHGATVSIDEQAGLIYLSRYDYLNKMDESQFYAKVLKFLDSAMKIQEAVESYFHGNEHAFDFE